MTYKTYENISNAVPRAALWYSYELNNAEKLRVTVHRGKIVLDTVETIH